MRFGTPDVHVYRQVYERRDYEYTSPRIPRVIIDCGAHIGLTTMFFAARFPDTSIIAVEPSTDNYAILSANVASIANVIAVNAAVTPVSEPVRILNPNAANWEYRTEPAGSQLEEAVPGLTIPDLMDRFGVARVDVLKLDVEGAELGILRNSADWINRVDCILAELHDNIFTGCSRTLYKATEDFAREWHAGEITGLARE